MAGTQGPYSRSGCRCGSANAQCMPRWCRGFTLIELMVGMVVSILCVLAMMSAFATFEGQKRTTTSGGDAQQSGSYSLYELERQIRTAGSGLTQGNGYGVWGCSLAAFSGSTQRIPSAAALPAPFAAWPLGTTPVNLMLMPVLIASGGTDAAGNAKPDVIAVVGGNPAGTVFQVGVTAGTNTTVTLDNAFGFTAGDYLLGTTTAGNCVLGKASSISATAPNPITLSAADSPPTTSATGFTAATKVFDLGPSPVLSLFGVDPTSHSLEVFDLLQRSGSTAIPIADGIVQIKALYGVDTTGTGFVDTWVQPTGTTWSIGSIMTSQATANAAYGKIKAIRVVVVAQSKLGERQSDYATGGSTLTLFPDLATSLQYTVTTQSQYRYKVYDTTIPIRNALITRYF
ncbi:MAG: PilW family protein [Rhodanobacter sp.]